MGRAPEIKSNPKFENLGSLITIAGDDPQEVLGYLLDCGDKGVFEPNHGRVAVTPADAKTHNAALTAALIAGLDNCHVGQWGQFHLRARPDGKFEVTSWDGVMVIPPADVKVTHVGRRVTFTRGTREFKGRVETDSDVVVFKRTK